MVCPPGYRITTNDIEPATTGLISQELTCRHTSAVPCRFVNSDFIAEPKCSKMSCGNFKLPNGTTASRQGSVSGTLVYPDMATEMLFGDTLTIQCDQHSVLSSSSVEQCLSALSITCGADGFESSFASPFIGVTGVETSWTEIADTCVPPNDKIVCAECYKYWGTGTDTGSRFPSDKAALDCNAGHCDPDLAQDHYLIPSNPGLTGSCQILRSSVDSPCLPTLCRPVVLPPNAARMEFNGQ